MHNEPSSPTLAERHEEEFREATEDQALLLCKLPHLERSAALKGFGLDLRLGHFFKGKGPNCKKGKCARLSARTQGGRGV